MNQGKGFSGNRHRNRSGREGNSLRTSRTRPTAGHVTFGRDGKFCSRTLQPNSVHVLNKKYVSVVFLLYLLSMRVVQQRKKVGVHTIRS